MRRFLISQVLHRRGRTLTLALGILVAAVSFTLLTSAARTSELTVKRIVTRNFRPAYDILVRPQDSFTDIERERGLVRENYLSGIYGGITMGQWRQVKRIPGVEVAAPIANVGYIMPFTFVPVTINRYLNDEPVQLYRLDINWEANGGVSRYPDSDRYVYYTRRHRMIATRMGIFELRPGEGSLEPCDGFIQSASRRVYTSPFDYRNHEGIVCYSERSPRMRHAYSDYGPFPPGQVGVTTTASFPILVAGIDPVEEQHLLNLKRTVVEGRFLHPRDRVRSARVPRDPASIVPVIAGSRTYVDEVLEITIERL
jgi:putative ABC transport system permease protein